MPQTLHITTMTAIFIAVATGATDAEAKGPPPPPELGASVHGLSAGVEMMVVVDFNETQTFNPGVMKNDADQVRVSHDPQRSEKIKFGQQFKSFSFAKESFSGFWRSAPFQEHYFIEFIKVRGRLSKDRRSVKWMELTRTRFDKASLTEPINRGFTFVKLTFRDLQHNPGLGNSVNYRFEPGKSSVVVEKAGYEYLETKSKAKVDTRWTFVKVDDGSNPLTKQPYTIFGNVTFEKRRPGPPAGVDQHGLKTVTVVGDWNGLGELITWLSNRPGVKIIDKTTKVQKAIAQEKKLVKGGLVANQDQAGAGNVADTESAASETSPANQAPRADLSKHQGVVIEVISTGSDTRDWSARARIRKGDAESNVILDLQHKQFRNFGEEAYREWVSSRTQQFHLETTAILENMGI